MSNLYRTINCASIAVLTRLGPENEILGSHPEAISAIQGSEPRLLDPWSVNIVIRHRLNPMPVP